LALLLLLLLPLTLPLLATLLLLSLTLLLHGSLVRTDSCHNLSFLSVIQFGSCDLKCGLV
jgi:hypothetical protein